MGRITVVFGQGVAVATIYSYNGSTYTANSYFQTTTFTNNNTSRYIEVTYVGAASGYTNATSNRWGKVYFTSGDQYIGLTADPIAPPTPTYYYATLIFNDSGGSGGPGTLQQSATSAGVAKTFTIPTRTPVKAGDTFLGWSSLPGTRTISLAFSANGGSGAPGNQTGSVGRPVEKVPGDTITVNTRSTTTLYAVWAGNSTYLFDIPYTVPYRDGYSFIGWSTSPSATTGQYSPGGTIELSSTTVLYAVWRKNVTLSYNANGGSPEPSSETRYVDTDGYRNFTISNTIPSKTGSIFNGWWLPSDTSPRWGGSILRLSRDATLTAAWIANTYNVYGYPSTGVSSFTINYTAANGNTVTKTFTTAGESVPVYAGTSIRFVSCTLSDGTYYENPIAKFCTDIDYPDNTLVAQYNASSAFTSHAINFSQNIQVKASIIQVTLSFDANGGTGEPDPITQNINTSFRIPAKVPTRDGYLFNGWYTDTDTGPYWSGDSLTLTHDQTLYATWRIKTDTLYLKVGTGITSFDISYINAAGNTINVTVTENQTVEAKDGTVVTFVSAQQQPTYVSPYGYIYPDADYPDYSNPLEAGATFTITQSMNMEAKANKASVTLFAYHEDGDVGYFQTGLPVHLALTAAAWNALKAKVKEVREIWQDPEASYLDVQVASGTEITAIEFNSMRTVIGNTTNHGTLPRAVAQGDIITPELFNGPSSLKSAINESIMEIIS